MRKFFPIIIIVIAAMVISPAILFAKQDGHHSEGGTYSAHPTASDLDSGPKAKHGERWAAEHKRLQAQMNEMDQRLDQILAAMNSATTLEQKVAAMSDAINELVAQRKQMVEMFKNYHAKMRGGMKGCENCPKHGKKAKGPHHEE